MAEPATYAGYKVGTIIAVILGAGVTSTITPGPWYLRLVAGAAGAATALVGTPVFAPLMIRLFEILYGYMGIPASAVPHEGVIGCTGFLIALVGIDVCRWLVDASKKMLNKIPLQWGAKK